MEATALLKDKDGDSSGRCSRLAISIVGFITRHLLIVLLVLGLVLGVAMGIGVRYAGVTMDARELVYFRFPGELLLRMLKGLVIPLIVTCVIGGLSSLDLKTSGRMGLHTVAYYLSTTVIAAFLGIALVSIIKPGVDQSVTTNGANTTGTSNHSATVDAFLDLLRNMFPDNILEACFKSTRTIVLSDNTSNTTGTGFEVQKVDGSNVLGLVCFSVALGIALAYLGELARPVTVFFNSFTEAIMVLVTVVIWYSPVGVMFLVAAQILEVQDLADELRSLGLFVLTVLAGLAIHAIIILPLTYLIFLRTNPYTYLTGCIEAYITAFGTSSSAATLPVTYRCLEQQGVDSHVTRFLLPVGATINMDGTALYEAVAAIFIAQRNGITLNGAQIITTSLTATLASIGAASIPSAGLVTLVIVLSALGLPLDDIAALLAIDWFLDRFRTVVNVEGDTIGAAIVAHLGRKDLQDDSSDSAHELRSASVKLEAENSDDQQ